MNAKSGLRRLLPMMALISSSWGFTGSSAFAALSLLPTAPSGFGTIQNTSPTPDGAATAVGGNFLDGFTFGTSLSGTYDSNVTQGSGSNLDPVESDFILGLGGSVGYLSKSSRWTFGGNYRGNYNSYFDQSELSGYDQGGGVVVNYDGGRLSAAFNAGVTSVEGINRNYSSEFVQQTVYNIGLTSRYQISSKTSLQGNINQSYTTATGSNSNNTEALDVGVSALWKYSPLTEFGPGIRYTERTGDTQVGRSSIGPTLSVNYKLGPKVALNSRIGMDYASYEDGSTADPAFSAALGLKYEASKLWGMNFSWYRDVQADPAVADGYTEVTSLRLGYHRKVRRAKLNLGVGYDVNQSEGPTGGAGDERKFLTFDSSLSMPVFANTSSASVFIRYNDQSSRLNPWDSIQTGFSITRSF